MWVQNNSFINTKTSTKKLQFGIDKCFKMHVGKAQHAEVCPHLEVDGWRVKVVSDINTKEVILEDEYSGVHKMEEVVNEKYLGDIIASDGKNTKNISARSNRGTGVVNQIMSMLEDICFGKYYFQVTMVFRNSLLISSLLTNAESWYNLTAAEIDELEKVDENLLRRVLEAPAATPKEMLYLELGVSPIRNIIKSRRINFLQYILKENEESLIQTFLMAQLSDPTRNDWGEAVGEDMEDLDINLSFDEIKCMSEEGFKTLLQKKEKIPTMMHLNGLEGSHKKLNT